MFLRETEYDSFSGITKKWYFDDDKIVCHKEFEEAPFVDYAKRLANQTIDASFINDNRPMHHMATLPLWVVEKILKDHNINMMGSLSPAEQTKLNRIIETEYPAFKTHTKKLWRAARKPKGD